MLEALIIRADGALAETEDLNFQVFQQVFEEAGFPWRADRGQFLDTFPLGSVQSRMTALLKQTVRWRAQTADMTPLIAAMQRRARKLLADRIESERLTPRPAMTDLVAAARREGLMLVLAASMREEAATALLRKTLGEASPGWFAAIVCRDTAADDDEKFYRQVIAKVGLRAENCLVVEGNISSARAARSLGLAAVTTRSSTCTQCDDGDVFVVEDLPSLIANSDKRRLDPLTADERGELLSVLNRLHAGNFDAAAKTDRSSAMRVSNILKSKGSAVKTIEPQASIRSLARALRTESVGVMVVTDTAGALKGIISERDLARGLADFGEQLSAMSVSDLMTTAVVTCTPDDGVANVARIMTQRRIRHLPVMSGHKIVGLISIGDVLKHRLDEVQLEANVLRDVAIARG